jgi:hypothetical protein
MPDAPHPRILFQDVPPELRDSLASLAGEAGFISEANVHGVHDSDWDLVVSMSSQPYYGAKLHVLSFGGFTFPSFFEDDSSWETPRRSRRLTAREARVGAKVEDKELRSLLERSVVQSDPGAGMRNGLVDLPPRTLPLVTVGAEEAVWAAFMLYQHRAIWALPQQTTSHVEWVAFVLRSLHSVDATRFPAEPDWRASDAWGTPSIRRSRLVLAELEAEREAVLGELERREVAAREAIELAARAGEVGALRLLTEQGEELLEAVAETFRSLGFEAMDMDDHHDEKTGAKLEDLRVSFSPEGGSTWTALVEVKGYGKGAKANDVAQILGRPPIAYFKETGREPDGLWHIVNSFREQDPTTRSEALSNENDLVVLDANGGCFIDTRDLFRAWRDVEEGVATPEQVRESLMAGRERWQWISTEASS